ncbi:PoNi-like cognate immunity protein [Ureibacillus acetophenoni]|uniref:Uncharacterized protein DUF1910 n=1 Tax=Ureibacillus acetophenoni TaxID=614649 RepID=A0A285US10_9BACL|nr:PoNi-like cognate immunity protein [Ureibacillus acetophenoni]SOC44178.1 uncharacterized protein DUF1910 [Ureibacillus acetophenoni]
MIRDLLKEEEYFIEYIAEETARIKKFETKLNNHEVREDRVLSVRKKVHDLRFQIFIAKYSMGDPVESLVEDYKELVEEMKELWVSELYEDMLWMLSIGIMLEIDENTFNTLVKLVENSNINDFLYNFIINSRKKGIDYQNSAWLFKEPFKYLNNVIVSEDDTKAINYLKEYLTKHWYVGHSDMGWYECHKHNEKLYFGYWSFESGAIAKILQLDDEHLRGVPYYPYDLVHYK